ncbi:MAG: type II toxin-antitoxin system RelB/DinJ family antitoxin [Clostridia bacterium]|nr:type II toxin-antitoxin system RelB/DinJ family antitoxin [Clostridia bacterium]
MAKTSSMHIRVEQKIKEEVESILKTLGMTTTEAINIYLRQIILNSGIPFEIKTPRFSDEMLEAIAEAEEMEKHPENYKSFNTVEEFMEDLHSEIQD